MLLVGMLTAGCRQKSAETPVAPVTDRGDLPLPSLPASLTDPEERADYLAAHFWDALDFSDTIRSLDTAFIEQNFANYSTVLALAPGRDTAVGNLLGRIRAASPAAYGLFVYVAEKYLYEPDSPVFDEQSYLPFARYAAGQGGDEAVVAQARCEEILKNAPGTVAPDFAFETPGGKRRLLDPKASAPLLLMFYEPDCDRCRSAMGAIASDPAIAEAISSGMLRFTAVYLGTDRTLWAEHAAQLPQEWTAGIEPTGRVDDDELYIIRATPSFYLIGADGRIILKDARLQEIFAALGR